MNKIFSVVAVLALVISGFNFFKSSSDSFGAIGTLPIENYIPAIRYNDGYYSEKDITTTGDLVVSGGQFTLTTSNTATSTLSVGCVQMTATSTATAIHLEFNTQATTTINGLSAGSVAWKYGSCPI